jgi:hypothetical protein
MSGRNITVYVKTLKGDLQAGGGENSGCTRIIVMVGWINIEALNIETACLIQGGAQSIGIICLTYNIVVV